MMLTEREARLRVCCGPVAANSSLNHPDMSEGPSCVGSACMAWRWRPAPPIRLRQPVVFDPSWTDAMLSMLLVLVERGDYEILVPTGTPRPDDWRERIKRAMAPVTTEDPIGYCGPAGKP